MIQRLIAVVLVHPAPLCRPPCSPQEHEAALSPFCRQRRQRGLDARHLRARGRGARQVCLGTDPRAAPGSRERSSTRRSPTPSSDREEAEARLKEYTEKLQAARAEAAAMHHESPRDAERLREELRQKAQAEADTHRPNARTPDSAGNRARPAADPPRGRRPVGDDRVEADPAEPVEGRQRAPDRRRAQAGGDEETLEVLIAKC